MYALLKKEVNTKNISIYFNQNYNFYKIYYNLEYIKLLGISINIIYNHISYKEDLCFIYINNTNILKTLYNIEKFFQKNILCFNLIRYLNKEKYIICRFNKNINKNINIKDNNIDIIINNIKYINGCYVPIINII